MNQILKMIILLWILLIYFNMDVYIDCRKYDLVRPKRDYPLAMLLLPKNYSYFPWALTMPAIKIGLKKIRNIASLHPMVKNMKFLEPVDSNCTSGHETLFKAVMTFVEEVPDVLIGPICDYVLAPIARMMPFWNRPILTPGAVYYDFIEERKTEFKTLTRVGTIHINEAHARLIDAIFAHFKWKRGRFVYYRDSYKGYMPLYCHALGGFIIKKAHTILKSWPIKIYNEIPRADGHRDAGIRAFLEEQIGNKNTIIILCADPDIVRRIMLMAAELNFTNGEYLFINIDMFTEPTELVRPWYRPNRPLKENKIAKKAYRYLMILTTREPNQEQQRKFSEEIQELAKPYYGYNKSVERVNTIVSSLYDAIILYAYALNKTLYEGGKIENGTLIVEKMRGSSVSGIYSEVNISPDGDRYTEFSLLDMIPETGVFQIVAYLEAKNTRVRWIPDRQIDWGSKDNKPPLDRVTCGYDNSGCLKFDKNMITGVVIGGILGTCIIISIIVGVFVHRRTKFLAELQAMNWIITWDNLEPMGRLSLGEEFDVNEKNEITRMIEDDEQDKALLGGVNINNDYLMMNNVKPNQSKKGVSMSKKRIQSTSKIETESIRTYDSFMDIRENQDVHIFANTARFKGAIVTLKRTSKRIEPNKELLMEIKKIKDLTNDHICRFIGACIDPNKQCWIYEYCPKGSLEDILVKQQIKLDWMFKYSLMQDICRGMIYLHNNYGIHGNLKSTNCLVDSRFVLKITDFGLKGFKWTKREFLKSNTQEYYKNLLWTAPEILREIPTTNKLVSQIGTVKGDVYSFAIICQEIVYRKGVFYIVSNEESRISAQEIITRVKENNGSSYITFRPSLYEEEGCTKELCQLIQDAWNEDPLSRPDFTSIKNQMKKLNKSGDTGNILDNLLSRMEQYATNLEDLVDQRTKDYLDEKQRAEDLLYSMLPKSIAHQLIKRQTVIAESYDMVTIFFSDIVGFTALSAESTPMEIIALLNQLYTTFDSIIENYDVYKVETIGDAYMVCSGLPQLNGNLHAREICRMAIAFLAAISKFVIPHRPDKQLLLRIGIHSGPVCSGVVGLKMPRYCLFGDTVNTSSRMESNGKPLKIHISSSTKEILDSFQTFIIRERGLVDMKGKGSQLTYWLHGENDIIVDPLTSDSIG